MPVPAVCNFRAAPHAGALIAARSAAAGLWLDGLPPGERIAALGDSRTLHGRLFAGLAPAAWPDAAGTWRGTPGSSVEGAGRAVFLARRMPGLRARDPCLPAAEVGPAMADLAGALGRLWAERPGLDDPWRDAAFDALAVATARFFAIHPYMDGNGHVWRLALPVLAARLGLAMRPGWTVDRRPWGPAFSLALQWHAHHPALLSDHLRRWLQPVPGPAPD